jgi:dihydrofolate synthase/folylpolyglutamate synthase
VAPVRALLRHLDEPHRSRLTVHVAGSKGKGSTAAMIASILRECGLKVGLYTSPHLHHFRERIRIDGEPISEESFAHYAAALSPAIEASTRDMPDRALVTFDLLTAMAFLAFREGQVDVQVLETGLGGRVDSTNAIEDKEVCVITAISLEHQVILGDTLPQIAAEKAGIITPGSTVVLAKQPESVAEVVRRTCRERDVRLVEADGAFRFERRSCGVDGQEVALRVNRTPRPLAAAAGPSGRRTPSRCAGRWALRLRHRLDAAGANRHGKVQWPGRRALAAATALPPTARQCGIGAAPCKTLSDDLGFQKRRFVIGVPRDKDTTGWTRAAPWQAASSLLPASPAGDGCGGVATAFSLNGVWASPLDRAEAIETALQPAPRRAQSSSDRCSWRQRRGRMSWASSKKSSAVEPAVRRI